MIPVATGADCVCGFPLVTVVGRSDPFCAVYGRYHGDRPLQVAVADTAEMRGRTWVFGEFAGLVHELDAMTLQSCGSPRGSKRHLERGEPLCDRCAAGDELRRQRRIEYRRRSRRRLRSVG